MAPHGKKLTRVIVQLSNSGFSSYKIEGMSEINSRTVQKFLKRVRERGIVEHLPRSGNRRKTSPSDDRILYRSIKSNRHQTLKDFISRFNARTRYSVSTRTVSRRLFEDGYKRCVVSKKITIELE